MMSGRQVTHVQIEDEIYIPAAELTILRHVESGKSRMIIATRDNCIILSQSRQYKKPQSGTVAWQAANDECSWSLPHARHLVPNDFFSPPDHTTGDGAVGASSPAPTWLVQLEQGGRRRVYKFECGLRGLRFRNAQCKFSILP